MPHTTGPLTIFYLFLTHWHTDVFPTRLGYFLLARSSQFNAISVIDQYDILWRERWSRSLWTKLWRGWRIDIPWGRTVKVSCWLCPLKANCFQWALNDRDGEKGFCKINSCISGTRRCVNLLKQWNHIWYSSCNWSHHILKFTVVHCYSLRSICLLYSQIGMLNGDVVGTIISAIFQTFDGSTNLCHPSRNVYCFCFTIFLGKGSSSGFHLAFSP